MTTFNKQLHEYKGVGGWLLLLCFILIVISPLYNIFLFLNQYDKALSLFHTYPGLRFVFYINVSFSLIISILSIRAGIYLFKIKPRALKIAKTFFLLYLGNAFINIFLPFLAGFPQETNFAMIPEIVTEAFRSVVFFGVWYPYLIYSKRVKATYSLSESIYGQITSSNKSKIIAEVGPERIKQNNTDDSKKKEEKKYNPDKLDVSMSSQQVRKLSYNSIMIVLIGLISSIILTTIVENFNERNSSNGKLDLYFLNFEFTINTSQAIVLHFIIIASAISILMSFFYLAMKAMGQRITPHSKKLFPFQFMSKGYYRLFIVISTIILVTAYLFSFYKILKASNGYDTDISYLLGATDNPFKNLSGFYLDLTTTISLTLFTIPIVYYFGAAILISVFKWVYDGFIGERGS